MNAQPLTLEEAARIVAADPALVARLNRDRMQDKSYQLSPLGAEVAAYLRHKRRQITDATNLDWDIEQLEATMRIITAGDDEG